MTDASSFFFAPCAVGKLVRTVGYRSYTGIHDIAVMGHLCRQSSQDDLVRMYLVPSVRTRSARHAFLKAQKCAMIYVTSGRDERTITRHLWQWRVLTGYLDCERKEKR